MSRESENASDEAVHVRIFNQTYVLRARNGSERISLIAQFVDERMRQIAAQITTYDASKIAVLAALNIADELQALKDQREKEMAALIAREADAAMSPPLEVQTEAKEGASSQAAEPQSWFDSIFDADAGPKPVRERRLSGQIAAKLQSIRHNEQSPSPISIEDAESG
ncbi:MAG: cell division protein ZapA [Pyrinomonadaceae bacterium]